MKIKYYLKKKIINHCFNHTFKMVNFKKIVYYILYNNLCIKNEEFCIKWYLKIIH